MESAVHGNLSAHQTVSASQAGMCLGPDAAFLGRRMLLSCPQRVAAGLGLGPLPCRRASADSGSVPLPALCFVVLAAGQAREDPSPLPTQGAMLPPVMGMPEHSGLRPNASPHPCFGCFYILGCCGLCLWRIQQLVVLSCLPGPTSPHIPTGQQRAYCM